MPVREELMGEARRMRRLQAESAEEMDIKRGRGGIADVEMLVYAVSAASGVRGGTLVETINELARTGIFTLGQAAEASAGYRFLSKIERFLLLAKPDGAGILPRVEERRSVATAAGYRDSIRKSAAGLLTEDVDYHRGAAAGLFESMTTA